MTRCVRIVYRKAGGPDVLDVVEEDLPQPGPGEVRVKVEASGVAYADIVQRNGLYPNQPKFPMTPGYDICGHVDALGEGVDGFAAGQRVAAVTVFGGYASHVCVPAVHLVPAPEGPDAAKIVALSLNYVTAYQMLHRCAVIAEGQSVLVHAAGGGVGSSLLELGRLYNLKMFGTVSPSKRAAVEAMGAVPIDYTTRDFVKAVREETGGKGVYAAFDAIDARHWVRSLKTLSKGGRLVIYGMTGRFNTGRANYFNLILDMMISRISAFSLFAAAQSVVGYNIQIMRDVHPDMHRTDFMALMDLLAQGRLDPLIAGTYPLTEAAAAQEAIVAARKSGKIVLLS